MLHCPMTLGNNINIIKSKFAGLIGNICEFNKIVYAFFFKMKSPLKRSQTQRNDLSGKN